MSSILETAPPRIALMAYDSDTRIKFQDHYFRNTFDKTQLPAVLVEIPETEYPATASNLEMPVEGFKLILATGKYGQGSLLDNEMEALNRSIVASIIAYFTRRTQLQFSDTRNAGAGALGPLLGVMYTRFQKGPLVPLQKEGAAVWGCEFVINVTSIMEADEIII